MLVLLKNKNPSALAHHESITVAIERSRCLLGFVVTGTHRPHRAKPGDSKAANYGFRPTREKDVRVPPTDHAPSFSDRVCRCCAGGDNREIGPLEAILHRDQPARHVDDHHRDHEWRDARSTLVHENRMLILEALKAADTAPDKYAKSAAIDLFQIQVGVFEGEFSRRHRQLCKSIGAPDVLRILEIQRRIKIWYLTRNVAIKGRGVELGNLANTTLAIHQVFPKRFKIASDRRNNSNTAYNDSSVAHEDSDTALDCNLLLSNRNLNQESGVPGTHPNHLYLLEKFSFGSNRGSYNDFRFLELTKIGGADVPHTGRDRSDEILTSIVYICRAEKDLAKRAGRSDPDPCPARQIGMWCRHPPVVSFTRRFDRFRESAADHHRVRAASQGFTNVASSAHSTVRDDRYIATCFLAMVVARGRAVYCSGHLGYA